MASIGAWYPDPTGRFELRWWDGTAWTGTVASGGRTVQDPEWREPASAALPSRPPAGGDRRPRLLAVAAVVGVVALIAGLVIAKDGDDDVGTGAAPTAGEGTATIGAAGGRVTAPMADGSGELTLELPSGAVEASTEISMEVGPSPGGDLAGYAATDPAIWAGLADYALDDEDTLVDPVFGPLLLAAGTELVGPEVTFGPAGLTLDQPAVLTVPVTADDFPAGTEPVVLLQGSQGWEVVPGATIDEAAGVLRVEIPHFSNSVIGRILSNILSNPAAAATREEYRAALETLSAGPADEASEAAMRGLLCGVAPVFQEQNVPPASQLLDYLGFEGPRIANIPQGAGARVRDQLMAHFNQANAAGNRQPHDISMQQLLGMTMAETGNDVFQALVLAHDVLRDNRESTPIQDVLANVRGDGGDERGARYHMVGTALYSFAYEHLRTTNQTNAFWPPSPEIVVSGEEAWVSGDIHTDTVEYAVDRLGARLGRSLYQEFRQLHGGNPSELLQRLCASSTSSTSTSSSTTSTLPEDIPLGSGDVQLTLQWTGDADMDLHVTDPSGEEIYYAHNRSASNGELDHDDIPACGVATGDHVENIFWPTAGAPTGRYGVWVRNFRSCAEGATQTAQLSVRVGGNVVHTEAVTLAGQTDSTPFTFTVR